MSPGTRRIIILTAILAIALPSLADAQSKRRGKKEEQAAVPATPGDKRDRTVAAPGTPFNGRAYWQAAAQCGGIYFKLGSIHSDAAIKAKVVKPDPAAYAQLTKEAETASRSATTFFEAAERFLIADRKLARDEAVMTYDPLASQNSDRIKTAEAGVQAAKACPELYATCHGAYPQVCNDKAALTN